jgi:hypothetical protein
MRNAVRVLAVASMAVVLGCGGLGAAPTNVSVRNEYAESLFSLSYSITNVPAGEELEGPATGVIFTDERVASYSTTTKRYAFTAPAGSTVTFTFSSMSLGDRIPFPPLVVEDWSDAGTYSFLYYYDLATAHFRVRHGHGTVSR